MTRTRLLAAVTFSAALCAAQQPAIHGLVLEPGTNQPIVGAEVWLSNPSRTTYSDDSGAFTIQLDKLGPYRVAADRDGYFVSGARTPARNYREVSLTEANPVADVRLYLVRPGTLTGNAVDAETGLPIANLRVAAAFATEIGGVRAFGGFPGTTDAEGRFAIANLAPGNYVAEVPPQADPKKRLLTEFTAKDLEAVDSDVEHTFWPGGHGENSAIPIPLASGATIDAGLLRVGKVDYYRVHLRIPASACAPDDTLTVFETTVHLTKSIGSVPCGKDLLITGFRPGSYLLVLVLNMRQREKRQTASVPFVIHDKNLDLLASLTPGVEVTGSFIAADGAKLPDLSKLDFSLQPLESFADSPTSATPDADGKFRLTGVAPGAQRVQLSGLGADYDVKENRYNSVALEGDILPLNQSAMTHSVTVVIDDKPAAITGVVMDGEKPLAHPYLILKKWPPPAGQVFNLGRLTTTGDDQGRFQFAGLTPGEYRLVALHSVDDDTYRGPNVLERAMAAANKIELGAAGRQNLTLNVTELR